VLAGRAHEGQFDRRATLERFVEKEEKDGEEEWKIKKR
jgi:hypothetical protein